MTLYPCPRHWYMDLKPGDTIVVDTRRLFMDGPRWTKATFEGWVKPNAPIAGIRNLLRLKLLENLPHRAPLLDREGDHYTTLTQDARPLPEEAS